jgi:hypothetical protein
MSAIFVGVLTFNLCFPTPRGPADNGDFFRVFAAFSSGPVGFTSPPAPGDPSYDARFFRHFLRAGDQRPPRLRAGAPPPPHGTAEYL